MIASSGSTKADHPPVTAHSEQPCRSAAVPLGRRAAQDVMLRREREQSYRVLAWSLAAASRRLALECLQFRR